MLSRLEGNKETKRSEIERSDALARLAHLGAKGADAATMLAEFAFPKDFKGNSSRIEWALAVYDLGEMGPKAADASRI